MRNLSDIVASVHADMAEHIGAGKVADYIPALSRVDPRRFGLAVVTCTGERAEAGDDGAGDAAECGDDKARRQTEHPEIAEDVAPEL